MCPKKALQRNEKKVNIQIRNSFTVSNPSWLLTLSSQCTHKVFLIFIEHLVFDEQISLSDSLGPATSGVMPLLFFFVKLHFVTQFRFLLKTTNLSSERNYIKDSMSIDTFPSRCSTFTDKNRMNTQKETLRLFSNKNNSKKNTTFGMKPTWPNKNMPPVFPALPTQKSTWF